MARASTKGGGNSHIRFILFEAEIPEGDIGPVTQAIQNALRGTAPTPAQRLPGPSPKLQPDMNGAAADPEVETEEGDTTLEVVSETPRPRASRKPAPTPEIIDIDMNKDVSLASFVEGKDAASHHKRFLIAATWLKEHRSIDAVSADHIYTCYRSIGWPTNIPDFGQPLRALKVKKYFTQPEKGLYAINHIGLDYVKKLGGMQ